MVGLYGLDWHVCIEFFNRYQLPFVNNPEANDYFRPYFAQRWEESVRTSVTNLLSTVFLSTPLPRLLRINEERLERHSLVCEVESMRAEIATVSRLCPDQRLCYS